MRPVRDHNRRPPRRDLARRPDRRHLGAGHRPGPGLRRHGARPSGPAACSSSHMTSAVIWTPLGNSWWNSSAVGVRAAWPAVAGRPYHRHPDAQSSRPSGKYRLFARATALTAASSLDGLRRRAAV